MVPRVLYMVYEAPVAEAEKVAFNTVTWLSSTEIRE
jgi:hypothetical protein